MTQKALRSLARAMGVHTRYTDGLGKRVTVSNETLVRVCASLGAAMTGLGDAAGARRDFDERRRAELVPPVIVAWDGILPPLAHPFREGHPTPLPFGYHRFTVEAGGRVASCTVIAAPVQAYRRPGAHRSWGVGAQVAALRSSRSRSVGDLRDLRMLCQWVGERGGDLVTALPLLPTFNESPAEPSPYSPVSRLFWSELILDLGDAHRPTGPVETLDVVRAAAEVRAALPTSHAPLTTPPSEELARYARFRGAQSRLGRNWRDWPAAARAGQLDDHHVDAEVERFHLAAQTMVGEQLRDLRQHLEHSGLRLGLDLAVGVHPDGYDPWSRQSLFAEGMSVGAPPDLGFPSGQDWGFSPVHPDASRREGHQYIAASIRHQAGLAGVLRVDHIMAWTRLYWIPHGLGLHEGTYVSYPADELFAILALESQQNRCEVVGENLGNVPPEIAEALPRHRIWGMYLAQFQDPTLPVLQPTAADVAMVGTHDTPTFAGWLAGDDISDRIRYGLLKPELESVLRSLRRGTVEWLAARLGADPDAPREFLAVVLEWLGRSDTPLVVPWLEDFWLEAVGVNLPGTPSSVRPNWQRPMKLLLDDILADAGIAGLADRLRRARNP